MLVENTSQLKTVDADQIGAICRELDGADIPWNEPYPEYGSAGMQVATLFNPTGEQFNFDYRDCRAPQQTPLLQKLPSIAKFLASSRLAIMGSRLLRLLPGAFLHEHRDFVYLENLKRLRLHLPLVTNQNAFIIAPGRRLHFKRGFLWKLDPKATVHSACNFGLQPRIHLMIDCYMNDRLLELLSQQWLDPDAVSRMPALTHNDQEDLLRQARQLLANDDLKTAEEILLRSFCQFDLGQSTSYDLLFELFKNDPSYSHRIQYWQERLKEVYMDRTPVLK